MRWSEGFHHTIKSASHVWRETTASASYAVESKAKEELIGTSESRSHTPAQG